MDQINITLADDHKLIRAGYRSILEEIVDIDLIGEASNGQEAIELVEELKPDVVVLDITMPVKSGLEAAREIRSSYPEVKILMLSMHQEEAYIKQSIENGADGYLVKDTDSEIFIEAIRTLHSGGTYYGETSSRVLVDSYINQIKKEGGDSEEPEKEVKLSKRETEVLGLVTKGLSSPEIAEQLFLSKRTVENHRANIMSKYGVHSVVELMSKLNNKTQ